jgi:hypothetical protein
MTLDNGVTVPAEKDIGDCWRTIGGEDIELKDATGWRPII